MRRYAVRVALVDLDAPPKWFVRHQAADHLTADEARAFAGTDGARRPPRGAVAAIHPRAPCMAALAPHACRACSEPCQFTVPWHMRSGV